MNSRLEESAKKIRTRDVPASWMNAHCRNLISKYALLAFHIDQTKFDLKSERIIADLSDHVKKAQSEELHKIYATLKKELRVIISLPDYEHAVSVMAEKSEYLTDHFSH